MTEWTDPETFAAAVERAETREKGNYFEFFAEGDRIDHDPGIRLTRHGNDDWMSQTLNHDPAYWRTDAARRRGFDEPPIHPDYLVACVMGPSVEALSEKGGYFLGRTDLEFHEEAVPPGTELRVRSTVESTRSSSSRPEYGIVTWTTEGVDAATGEPLLSYERTNMLPRREPLSTDGGGSDAGDGADGDDSTDDASPPGADLPEPFVTPDGGSFEDFAAALEEADERGGAVAYRHERGRTMDDHTVAALPLATLNTARQHHNADLMADSPSGDIVAYGDVTRSTALAHARSDERTWRERRFADEAFHDFVTPGDTVYCFTRVLACGERTPDAGEVTFEHVAFTGDRRPVYSGTRTALIERTH